MEDIEILIRLKDYLIQGKNVFNQYKSIFLSKDTMLSKYIISSTAPAFFEIIYNLFWENIILSISKLTDPAHSGKNDNMSLASILNLANKKSLRCSVNISIKYKELQLVVETIRTYRTKIIAHNDFVNSFNSELNVKINTVSKAYELCEEILNLYYLETTNSTWNYNITSLFDAKTLMFYLENALIYEDFKKNRNIPSQDNIEYCKWKESIKNVSNN